MKAFEPMQCNLLDLTHSFASQPHSVCYLIKVHFVAADAEAQTQYFALTLRQLTECACELY